MAARTGISPKGQRRIEEHVTVAEQYPFMQQNGWRQYHVVLEAAVESDDPPTVTRRLFSVDARLRRFV